MKIEAVHNGYELINDQGKRVGEITYSPASDDFVIADHTFVDPSLRGKGAGDDLLDHLVAEMDKQGKKIKALCPFVVKRFNENDKYDFINYDKQ